MEMQKKTLWEILCMYNVLQPNMKVLYSNKKCYVSILNEWNKTFSVLCKPLVVYELEF